MKNIVAIDYSKFIGIYLVILGHAMQSFGMNCDFIYMFHMPLFFIISGFLYSQKTKKENYNIILYRLICPYIFYQMIYFPFKAICISISQHIDIMTVILKLLAGSLIGDCYITSWSYVNCGACWFIITTIYLRFIFAQIKLSIINLLILSLISAVFIKILFIYNLDLLFCLDNLLYVLPYFIFGQCIKQIYYENHYIQNLLNKHKQCYITLLISILLFVLVYIILKINGLIECNMHIKHSITNKSLLLSYIAGLCGSISILNFACLFKKNFNIINLISKNTLFIIFFHTLLLLITKMTGLITFITNIIHNKWILLIFISVYSIFILALSYIVIIKIKNKIPLLLGKKYNN